MLYRYLNARFKEQMKARLLSEDELREAAGGLKKKQKNMFIWWIVATVFIDGLLIFNLIDRIIKGTNPDSLPVSIAGTALLCIIVGAFIYFALLGVIKIQFNKALKENYPELLDELKL